MVLIKTTIVAIVSVTAVQKPESRPLTRQYDHYISLPQLRWADFELGQSRNFGLVRNWFDMGFTTISV